MLTEDGKHLYISHDDYHRLIEQLALMIHKSGWEFDTILCLARGGMRPGDVLSRIFDVPLAIMSTSSYRDDLADSGKTLHSVMETLRAKYPSITDMRSAVLWTKGVSTFAPDYTVQNLPTSPWIHQPFELYDSMRPHDIEARHAT